MTKRLKEIFFHCFLPSETNNYRAKALHFSSLIFYLTVIFAFQLWVGVIKEKSPQILGYALDVSAEKILFFVNQEREKEGLKPLILSPELTEAASLKASDMFAKNYWAHISPTGATPWEFIKKAGYDYLYAGENLAKDFDYSQEIVEAWMASPSHRANILKPEYQEIGIAVMNGILNGSETTLVVQEFGTRTQFNHQKEIDSVSSSKNLSAEREDRKETPQSLVFAKKISFLPTKKFSLFLTEFLLVILFFDSLFIWRNRVVRVSGHSLSHIIFFLALIGAIGATGVGVIL